MRRLLPLFLLASLARAEPTLAERVDALAAPYCEDGRIVGMVVGVFDGKEEALRGYGASMPGPDTVYEIGSVSKVFTGVLLAALVRDGVVRLDQPVAELLPEGSVVPAKGERRVTLLDLSTHTSYVTNSNTIVVGTLTTEVALNETSVPPGGSPTVNVTVRNLGSTSQVNVRNTVSVNTSLTDAPFTSTSITTNLGTLAAGASTTFSVQFTLSDTSVTGEEYAFDGSTISNSVTTPQNTAANHTVPVGVGQPSSPTSNVAAHALAPIVVTAHWVAVNTIGSTVFAKRSVSRICAVNENAHIKTSSSPLPKARPRAPGSRHR